MTITVTTAGAGVIAYSYGTGPVLGFVRIGVRNGVACYLQADRNAPAGARNAWSAIGPVADYADAVAAADAYASHYQRNQRAAGLATVQAAPVEPVASVVGEAGSRFQLAADAHPSFPIRAGVIEATDAPQLPGDDATVRVRFDGEPEARFVRPDAISSDRPRPAHVDIMPTMEGFIMRAHGELVRDDAGRVMRFDDVRDAEAHFWRAEDARADTGPAYLAIQCQREGHPRGTFLYQGDNWRTGRLVSPVFEDSVRLYQWATANGWHSLPYDPAHPVGVYAQAVPPAPAMVPQPVQQQQARARGRAQQPARGERRYVTVRDTETGDVHRVLTSVARVGVAVVIFTPSNRHRQGALGGMLITHDDIRKAWVFNDEAEARRMLSRNGAPGERVIRAELVSDPAAA